MTRVCLGFALALTGLALCLWAGNWFGLGLIALGLVFCPSEEEEQARMGRPCVAYRRAWGFSPENRAQVRYRV